MRAALYTRVSSQEQAQHGVSLNEQKERLEMWAKLEGWEVAGLYSDEGYSGGTDNRPDLQRLMADAKAKNFDVVAVTKIDRLFRNTRLLLNYIHDLESFGITFVAQAEGIDTSKPGMGKIILSMLGSVAEWERGRIGDRVKDFRRHLTNKGQWSSGRTPFGCRFNKQTKELVIDPLEAEAIRFIFNAYTENQLGIVRTAELCNQQRMITPRAGRRKHTTWTQSAIRHVLTHPGYKGGPNEAWPFKTPAIVSPEIWQAAQRQLAGNRHFRATEGHNPLTGLLRCGLCGKALRIGYNHNKNTVWECPGRLKATHLDGSPRCTLPRLDSGYLVRWLVNETSRIFSDEDTLRKYIADTIKNLEKEQALLERKLRPIQSNTKRTQEAMQKADTMFELGRLSSEDYRARIAGLRKRLQELERQTIEADPLLLKQLAENDSALKYHRDLPQRLDVYVKHFEKMLIEPFKNKEPELSDDAKGLFNLGYIATILDFNRKIDNHNWVASPGEGIAQYLRQFGLYVYVHPRKLEIKGAIRQINTSVSCNSDINIPLCITLNRSGAGD